MIAMGENNKNISKDIRNMLQGTITLMGLVQFVDEYINAFKKSEKSKQFLFALGNKSYFLSDMLKLAENIIDGYDFENYNAAGWAVIDTKAKAKTPSTGMLDAL
ncbi:MAG: hypothetical protein ACOC1K_06515 [Nanoarchaeota archaeon]